MIEKDDEKIRRVIEKAWQDPAFKKALMTDAARTLNGEGLAAPEDVTIEVLESSPTKRYFVIPPAPDSSLSPDEVKRKSQSSDYRALVHLLYNVNCC